MLLLRRTTGYLRVIPTENQEEIDLVKCLLDTNSLLHFIPFDQVDWRGILESPNVVLVFSAPVLRELDRMKFAELDIEIRNRCKRIISTISSYEDDPKVRDSVTVEFLVDEVQVDWVAENLDKELPDDRIIAAAMKLSANTETVLVTADIGLRLKAKFRGIKTLQLPDDLAIRAKKTKAEGEVATLKSRLAVLENQIPHLVFGIEQDGEVVTHRRISWKRATSMDPQHIQLSLSTTRLQLSKYANPPETTKFHVGLSELTIPEPSEYDRYRKETESYITDLNTYFTNEWQYQDKLSRLVPIDFVLDNRGTVPADDVQIRLHFPDGFALLKASELFSEPERPREPIRPRSLIDRVGSLSSSFYATPISPNTHLIAALNPRTHPKEPGVQIKKTNSYDVQFDLKKLMHTTKIRLERLYLYFESYLDIRGFSCTYKIIANNTPEAIAGVVNFSFEETEA